MTLPSSLRLLMVHVCIWPRILFPSIMNPPPYWSESCRKEIAPSFLMKTLPQLEASVAQEPLVSNAFAGVPQIEEDTSAEIRTSILDFIVRSPQANFSVAWWFCLSLGRLRTRAGPIGSHVVRVIPIE